METIYGDIKKEQLENYKKLMHKNVHWMLLYKDPALTSKFANIDYEQAFICTQRKMAGFSRLTGDSPEVVEILVCLEGAKITADTKPFNHKAYRKLIFEAHDAIDRLDFSSCDKPSSEGKEDDKY